MKIETKFYNIENKKCEMFNNIFLHYINNSTNYIYEIYNVLNYFKVHFIIGYFFIYCIILIWCLKNYVDKLNYTNLERRLIKYDLVILGKNFLKRLNTYCLNWVVRISEELSKI